MERRTRARRTDPEGMGPARTHGRRRRSPALSRGSDVDARGPRPAPSIGVQRAMG